MISTYRFVLAALLLSLPAAVSSERPRWVDGNAVIGDMKPGSYWSFLYGGAKAALNNILNSDTKDMNAAELGSNDVIKEVSSPEKIDNGGNDLLLEQAHKLVLEGNIDQAIDTLFALLDSDPYRIDANIAVGFLLMNIRKPELAENFLFTAVRMSEWKNAGAVAYLAECLRLNDDSDLGEKVAMRGLQALNNNDESGAIAEALGNIKVERKDYAIAADWFLASALLRPQTAESWLKASTMQFPSEGRDLKFAENVLLQGIENNPNDAQLLYQLGVVMHSTDHIDEAIVLYEAALGNDPTLRKVKSTLATAYHAVRRFEEAAILYGEAVTFEPSNVVLLANYALLLCNELGRASEGMLLVRDAKEINQYSADVIKAEADCMSAEELSAEEVPVSV